MNEVEIVVTGDNRVAPTITAAQRDIDRLGDRVVEVNRRIDRDTDRSHRGILGSFGRLASSVMSTFGRMGGKVGESFGEKLPGSLGKAFGALPPQVQAAAAAAALAIGLGMSTVIGAAITSGVLLAVGGGVLVAGIVSAVKNSPAVQAAFASLGDRASEIFNKFGVAFREPLVRAAGVFDEALKRVEPTLLSLSELMAPLVDKLAPALAGLFEKTLPGIGEAVAASVPLFEVLARHLPKLGESISRFFSEIAEGGPGAERFLDGLLGLLEEIIPVLGSIIGWLSAMFLKIDNGVSRAAPAFGRFANIVLDYFGMIINGAAKAFGWIPGIGPKLNAAARDFNSFRDRVNRALAGIKDQTVNVTVYYREKGRAVPISNQIESGIGGRAHGGVVGGAASGGVRSNLVEVGEHGRELLELPAGTQVHSNPDTERMLGGMAGGPTEILLRFEKTGDKLLDTIIEGIQGVIRTQGNSDPQTYLAGA